MVPLHIQEVIDPYMRGLKINVNMDVARSTPPAQTVIAGRLSCHSLTTDNPFVHAKSLPCRTRSIARNVHTITEMS
jgi:hypothetical protein